MTLATIGQDDFAVGTLRGVAPDVQPGVGVYAAINAMLNDDGDLFRRGGSRYLDPGYHLDGAITWIWSGFLGAEFFTLVSDLSGVYTSDNVLIGGSAGLPRPVQVVAMDTTLFFPNGDRFVYTPGSGLLKYDWALPPSIDSSGDLHLATIAGRLVVASGNTIAFSEAGFPETFTPDDYHTLPGGVQVRGLAAIQDTLLVFTNYGLWAISNMAYNLTDAAGNIQQTLALIVPEMSLLHEAGLAPWQGRFIAPCADRVYFVDAVSAPVPISDSITPMYAELVRQGARPGLAKVHRNTLFLPMLKTNQSTLEEENVATLTCRVDRPIQGRYTYFPWAEHRGHAAKARAFDIATRTPNIAPIKPASFLLGGGEDGFVSDLTDIFRPSATNARDADNTSIEFQVETRDFPTGQGQPNHLKRVRLTYTLEGAAQIAAEITDDRTRTTWVALGSEDLTAPGEDPAAWWLHPPARVRYARARLTLTGDPARLVFHRIEMTVRPASHAR
jgi:hypothetical protein